MRVYFIALPPGERIYTINYDNDLMTPTLTTPTLTTPVALVACECYDRELVEKAILRGIDLLGGIGRFVVPGERILLKPNLLYAAAPDKCVTTNPVVVAATARVFADAGAHVVWGDSPAWVARGKAAEISGVAAAARNAGALPADMETPETVTIMVNGHARPVVLAKTLSEVDSVISLPKCKTHDLMRMTGAVKNLYGCVPGITKGRYHTRFPNPDDFADLLAAIALGVGARLHIMDAIVGMDGRGPGSGDPFPLKVLIMSTDPVALDAVMCRIVSVPASCVPTLAAGERAGLGTADHNRITLVGDPLEQFTASGFNAVRIAPLAVRGPGLLAALRSLLVAKPRIISKACRKCGNCVEVCPAVPRALSQPNQNKPPVFDYASCIRCFCCAEICPHKAITVKTPLAGRLLPLMNYLSLALAIRRNRRSTLSNE